MSEEQPKRYQDLAPGPPEGDIDLEALVPGQGPIEIDLGFGRGLSLLERAAAAPEARLIGIEIKAKWAHRVERRVERAGLERVAVLWGDAKDILRRAGPPGSVRRVFVHFPDPWWKKRHTKRRVVGDELLDSIARLLAPGGELFVQTDVAERAEDYRRLLLEHPAFELAGRDGWLHHNPFGARSNRERRADEDGLPIHRLLAHRGTDLSS